MKKTLFTITVDPNEHVLAYRHGVRADTLGPGRHPHRGGTTYVAIPATEQLTTLQVQEIPTSEAVLVRVSLAIRWRVADPVAYHERADDPVGLLHLAAQVALREAVAKLSVTDVAAALRQDAGVLTELRDAVVRDVAELGIAVERVVMKDVILPLEIRNANADVLTARQQGLAQLERARAETAALRALANGAKLLDDHPALANLRLVQAAGVRSEVKLHLGGPATG